MAKFSVGYVVARKSIHKIWGCNRKHKHVRNVQGETLGITLSYRGLDYGIRTVSAKPGLWTRGLDCGLRFGVGYGHIPVHWRI